MKEEVISPIEYIGDIIEDLEKTVKNHDYYKIVGKLKEMIEDEEE